MLVLKILLPRHLHGYGIAQLIQQLSDDLLQWKRARSTRPCSASTEWLDRRRVGLSANNRRARFYKLTPDGRRL